MSRSVLFVAGEGLPFIKTGGLADVIGSLPRTLAKRGQFKFVLDGLTNQQRSIVVM